MRTPEESLGLIQDAVSRAGVTPAEVLAALLELRRLRELLTTLEPRLIAIAREQEVSWAALAEVLGVASRQAAERRYLRLRPAESPATSVLGLAVGSVVGSAGSFDNTADQRVQAVRDRRAGDRAVMDWARRNSAMLRRLAGNVSSLGDLSGPLRVQVDLVQQALADNDTATLLGPLAAAAPLLATSHPAIAEQINHVTETTLEVRRQTQDRRSRPS
jgi:hypothetical protein